MESWYSMKKYMTDGEEKARFERDYEDDLENRICRALDIIDSYSQIDGEHHKAWVIDQVVRILINNTEMYEQFVKDHKEGEDGPDTYEWYTGIAP